MATETKRFRVYLSTVASTSVEETVERALTAPQAKLLDAIREGRAYVSWHDAHGGGRVYIWRPDLGRHERMNHKVLMNDNLAGLWREGPPANENSELRTIIYLGEDKS